MRDEDVLFITADHGNDSTIGSTQHTREKTFVPVYDGKSKTTSLGEMATLSDIAATIADYLTVEKTENGTSFLPRLV